MWIRMIEIYIDPENLEEFRKIYSERILPAILAHKGNIHAFLMESQDRPGQIISFSSWKTREEGNIYESSGDYVKNVNQVKHLFLHMPTLWSYTASTGGIS